LGFRVFRVSALLVALTVLAPVLPATAADGPPEPVIVLLHEPGDGRGKPEDAKREVEAALERLRRSEGVRPTHSYHHALRGFAAEMTPGQVRRLERDPSVEAVIPDSVVELAAQTIPAGIRRVGAVAAPATRIDGVDGGGHRIDADVAIIDTGIQSNHPDLNVVGGYNCASSNTADWADKQGHGTHVAGIVGALDNGSGVVGTAPGVRLWSVRVFDANAFSRISWIVCGIDWVTGQRDAADPDGARIEVVNMSLRDEGGDDGNCGFTTPDAEHRAICRSVAGGTTYVVAAGNDDGSATRWRPASYNEVITVSAIADYDGRPGGLSSPTCTAFGVRDGDDTFANFSNYGFDVDITAPGVCVRSTLRGSSYGVVSGTSMASPHVAGAAAVYKALHPTDAPTTVRAALIAAGSAAWNQGTDPDSHHEPLLDMSSFGATPGPILGPTPAATSIWAGHSGAAFYVDVRRGSGYHGDVAFSLDGVPTGVSGSFSTNPLGGWATGAIRVVVKAARDVPAGTWDAELVASGGVEVRRPMKVTVRVDPNAPTTTAPRLSIRSGVTMTPTSIPLRVAWSGTDAESGIIRYEQQEQRNDGAFKSYLLGPSSTVRNVNGPISGRHGDVWLERVQATDRVGNVGEWATGPRVELVAFTELSSSARYTGSWGTSRLSSNWGSRARYTRSAGASATLTFRGNSVGWVATTGPSRGKARVYVDGTLVQTVDLYRSTTRYRQVVFSRDLPEGTHTIRIVALATSGRPRVDIDGFTVLRGA
jgi:hypothetical protein